MSLEKRLSKFSFVGAATFIGALCTFVDFQPFTHRLEELLTLISKHARGEHTPSKSTVESWMTHFLADVAMMEDPPEYPFIMNVCTRQGTFRIFEGLATGCSTHIEYLCEILDRTDVPQELEKQKRQLYSLLTLGDLIAERLDLVAYVGRGYNRDFNLPSMDKIKDHVAAITFDALELQEQYPSLDLDCFIAPDLTTYEEVVPEDVGPVLERFPLYRDGDTIYVIAPSFLAMALRRNLLEAIVAIKAESWFAKAIEDEHIQKALNILSMIKDIRQTNNPFDEKKINPKLSYFTNFFGIFDKNIILHVSIINFDPRMPLKNGIRSMHKMPEGVEDAFSNFLVSHVGPYFKAQGYDEGIHLYIVSGIGEYCLFSFKGIAEGWSAIGFTLPDLDVLICDEGFTFSRIYKYVREMNRLRDIGTMVLPSWDTFPLYSQWRLNEFRFATREFPFPGLTMFSVAFDASLPLRTEILTRVDTRMFYIPHENRYLMFKRFGYNSLFSYDLHKPIYTSYDKAKDKILYGIAKTSLHQWQIEAPTTGVPVHPQLIYKFWETILCRMLQIANYAIAENLKLKNSIHVTIIFDKNFDWQHKPEEGKKSVSTVKSKDDYFIILCIGTDVFDLMMTPANSGERLIMELLADAILKASGKKLTQSEVKEIVQKIEPNQDSRYIHLFEARSPISLQNFNRIQSERFVQLEDESFFSIGLAWEISDYIEPTKIEGQEDCLKFYVNAVDKYWEKIKSELNKFHKDEIINFCMGNLNSLKLDSTTWDNTSRAVMALSSDKEETYRVASKKSRDRDTASLCNRVLIEMANCECKGDDKATLIQIDELVAKISILLYLSSARDAISDGLAPPNIELHPNGEVTIDRKLIHSLVPAYIQALDEKSFNDSIDSYDSHFEEDEEGPSFEDFYGKELIKAFIDEFEINPENLLKIFFSINKKAMELEIPHFRIKLADLKAHLVADIEMTDAELATVLKYFVLYPRTNWSDVPTGFTISDILPWRYQRRLSLVMRPILAMDNTDNPELFINMSLLWSNFNNYMYLIQHGYLKQEFVKSPSMIAYLGNATRKQGNSFEDRCQWTIENGTWKVRRSVEMKTLGAPASLGEVDLLAWDEKHPSKIYIIECKKLKLAKTVGEIGDQLKKFKGDTDDLLAKHLARVEWINQNPATVVKLLGLNVPKPKYMPLIITSNPVPMQFYPDHPNLNGQNVIDFDNLKKIFNK